jgi:hypothetical protein
MVTGVPGAALPWSERSTLRWESRTKMLKERIRRHVIVRGNPCELTDKNFCPCRQGKCSKCEGCRSRRLQPCFRFAKCPRRQDIFGCRRFGVSNRYRCLELSTASKGQDSLLKRGKASTNLLVITPLRGEADDGLLVLAREVAGGSSLFVGDEVSLSRRNHDVR